MSKPITLVLNLLQETFVFFKLQEAPLKIILGCFIDYLLS